MEKIVKSMGQKERKTKQLVLCEDLEWYRK